MEILEEKTYPVFFLDDDGITLLKEKEDLKYGDHPIPPQVPIKTPSDNWEYVFNGWFDQYGKKLNNNTIVTGSLIYTAQYKEREHTYKKIFTKKASCTEDGYEEFVCVKCQHKAIRTTIQKRGHNWQEIIIKEPTCLEPGEKKYICSNTANYFFDDCGEAKEGIIIPPLGHLCVTTNIAKNKSALRRGAAFQCIRDGCDYNYTLYFQVEENRSEEGEMPESIGDTDRRIGKSILHIGANVSAARGFAHTGSLNEKKFLYLSDKEVAKNG